MVLEGFFYPHGASLVITLTCDVPRALDAAVAEAQRATRSPLYRVTGQTCTLKELAGQARAALYRLALGPETAARSLRDSEPFSVATVVRGSGVDPEAAPVEGAEIHRALDALATWNRYWRKAPVPSLAKRCLEIKNSPAGHVLYGSRRGRVVWFPALFTEPAGGLRSLACYHRNLVLATMQVESLTGLAVESKEQLEEGGWVSPLHRECARHGVDLLGRLYGGVGTYRSCSPRAQLEQNELVGDVNWLRDRFDRAPLA
jgi:hypothetical protein